jgi:hypothetical protein
MPDDPADVPPATDDDTPADVVGRLIADGVMLRRGGACPAHHPTARLVADLPLAEQLDAVASMLPCDWPAGELQPGSPAAGLLKQCAHAIRHLIGQRDRAVELVRNLNQDQGAWRERFDDDPLVVRARELLAEVDGSPAYAEPPCCCETAEVQP